MRSATFINTSSHAYERGYRFYCAHLCTVQQKSSPSLANISLRIRPQRAPSKYPRFWWEHSSRSLWAAARYLPSLPKAFWYWVHGSGSYHSMVKRRAHSQRKLPNALPRVQPPKVSEVNIAYHEHTNWSYNNPLGSPTRVWARIVQTTRPIDYVCQQLRKDPNIPVQTLFIDAGYRSRTTAWRHFTTIVGCTPSEFVERSTKKGKTENWKTENRER